MSDIEKAIGKRIAEFRKKAGLTQQRLAEINNITTETISRLERGSSMPSIVKLCRIAESMGYKPKELFVFSTNYSEKDIAIQKIIDLLQDKSLKQIKAIERVAMSLFEEK